MSDNLLDQILTFIRQEKLSGKDRVYLSKDSNKELWLKLAAKRKLYRGSKKILCRDYHGIVKSISGMGFVFEEHDEHFILE